MGRVGPARRGAADAMAGVAAIVVAAAVALAGCAPAPTAGPPLAVSGGGPLFAGGGDRDAPPSDAVPADPMQNLPIAQPKVELGACPYLHNTPPDGVTQRCGRYDAGQAVQKLGAALYMAVLSTDTADFSSVPPIVVSPGSDRSFEAVTAQWAAALDHGLDHPVVVVEPRTSVLDSSTCDPTVATAGDELAGTRDAPTSGQVHTETAELARGCQDPLGDNYLEFGAQDIAKDFAIALDTLGLDRAIIGASGGGIRAAVAFGTANPSRMAGLVVDSPTPIGTSLEEATTSQADGAQLALKTWLSQCRVSDCTGQPLPQQAPTIDDGKATVEVAGALRTMVDELAGVYGTDPVPNAETMSTALATLDNPAAAPPRWRSRNQPGTFYGTCTDYSERPSADAVADVIQTMQNRNPTFGADLGYRMLLCADWPVGDAPAPRLPDVQAIVLGSTGGDPLAGTDPAGAGAAALTNAGLSNTVPLRWGGLGSTTIGRSDCVADAVNGFLRAPEAAVPGACPA